MCFSNPLAAIPKARRQTMLTRKQHELLLFINRRLAEGGVSPSFEEMKEALNLKSKSGIHRLISGLEERGFIKRLAHRARALEVVKLPEETAVPVPKPSCAKLPFRYQKLLSTVAVVPVRLRSYS